MNAHPRKFWQEIILAIVHNPKHPLWTIGIVLAAAIPALVVGYFGTSSSVDSGEVVNSTISSVSTYAFLKVREHFAS